MTTHLTKRDRQRAEYEAEAREAAKRSIPLRFTNALGETIEISPALAADVALMLAGGYRKR